MGAHEVLCGGPKRINYNKIRIRQHIDRNMYPTSYIEYDYNKGTINKKSQMHSSVYTPKNNMSPTISHTYTTTKYQGLHIRDQIYLILSESSNYKAAKACMSDIESSIKYL